MRDAGASRGRTERRPQAAGQPRGAARYSSPGTGFRPGGANPRARGPACTGLVSILYTRDGDVALTLVILSGKGCEDGRWIGLSYKRRARPSKKELG